MRGRCAHGLEPGDASTIRGSGGLGGRRFFFGGFLGDATRRRGDIRSRDKTLSTDVLVCGGGCAGTAAALSAARQGARVLLVEKAPFAGGIVTSVGLPYFDGIANIRDHRIVVRGIALELLSQSGVCAANATKVDKHNPTIPNTFEFKLLLDRLLREQQDRLTVLFNTFVCGVETTGDRITSVTVANKDGLVTIQPKVIVDCTGDADVAAWGGRPSSRMPKSSHSRCISASEMSPNGPICRRTAGPRCKKPRSGANCRISTAPA